MHLLRIIAIDAITLNLSILLIYIWATFGVALSRQLKAGGVIEKAAILYDYIHILLYATIYAVFCVKDTMLLKYWNQLQVFFLGFFKRFSAVFFFLVFWLIGNGQCKCCWPFGWGTDTFTQSQRYRYSCIVNVPKQPQQRMAYNLKMYPRDTLHITAMACQVLTWKFPSLHSFPHQKPDKRAEIRLYVCIYGCMYVFMYDISMYIWRGGFLGAIHIQILFGPLVFASFG